MVVAELMEGVVEDKVEVAKAVTAAVDVVVSVVLVTGITGAVVP